MPLETVRDAYSSRAKEYAALFGTIESTAEADRAFVSRWADQVTSPVVDVGCGPGQWTDFLCRLGVDATGIDPVDAFVRSARTTYPTRRFRAGQAEKLGVDTGSLGGTLAWYSLIHTAPDDLEVPLREFARCLAPGGSLALGFFTGDRIEPFDHAVATAYFWPLDQMVRCVEAAGFTVTHTEQRQDPGARPHGALIGVRGT